MRKIIFRMSLKLIIPLVLQVMLVTFIQAQTQHRIVKIEFMTLTRGAHENVTITNDSVQVEKQSMGDEKATRSRHKLNHKDWINLLNTLHTVSLQDIPSLKSPTNDRAFDGARHSTITIITDDEQSVTHSFDNEKPNEKLKLLMLAIRKITRLHG